MSQFAAIVDRSGARDLAALLARAKTELVRGGSRATAQTIVHPPFAAVLLTHDGGAVFREDEDGIGFSAGAGPESPSDAAFVAACRDFAARMPGPDSTPPALPEGARGRRCFVHWSKAARELIVVTEPNGQLPLYVLRAPDLVGVGSEVKGLWALAPGLHPDLDGLADFLTLGHCLGERTLFREVACLEPGAVYRINDAEPSWREYHRPRFNEDRGGDVAALAERLNQTVLEILTAYRAVAPRISVALSGGMDSRYLLAGARRVWNGVESVTFGEEGSTDVAAAMELAWRSGVRSHRFGSTPTFLRDWAPYAVWRADGMLSCLHAHGMDGLISSVDGAHHVLNGVGGDHLTGAFLRPEHVVRRADPKQAARMLLATRRFHSYALSAILKPEWISARADATESSLVAIASRYSCERMGNLMQYYWLRHYAPRITALGLMLELPHLEHLGPLADPAFVRAASAVPLELRFMSRAYRRALGLLAPELATVPWERTGVAPQYPWVFHAFGRAGRRLGALPRPRPAVDHATLLRSTLRDWVRELLLDPRTAGDGCFLPGYLSTLVDEHARGHERTAELGMAITVELWRRIFLEGETDRVVMPALPKELPGAC